jgi:hypothetical protein
VARSQGDANAYYPRSLLAGGDDAVEEPQRARPIPALVLD